MRDAQLFTAADDVPALKRLFAAALLREPVHVFAAAQQVFGSDAGRALYAASMWLNDPDVLAEKTKLLKDKGARSFLPSKEDYARELWKLAMDSRTPIEDKRGFLSLFGDAMGYKETLQKNMGGVTVNNNSRVMIVRDFGDDDAWEAQAAAQQHKLTRPVDVVDATSRTVQ
jgi:hypothetical protein